MMMEIYTELPIKKNKNIHLICIDVYHRPSDMMSRGQNNLNNQRAKDENFSENN